MQTSSSCYQAIVLFCDVRKAYDSDGWKGPEVPEDPNVKGVFQTPAGNWKVQVMSNDKLFAKTFLVRIHSYILLFQDFKNKASTVKTQL